MNTENNIYETHCDMETMLIEERCSKMNMFLIQDRVIVHKTIKK